MKAISVINLKGGVGKTFTCYNVAHELEKNGYKVLVIDNDKQGNISKAFGCYTAAGECGTAKALRGNYKNPLEIIKTPEQGKRIDVIPANMSLMQAVWEIGGSSGDQIGSYERLLDTEVSNFDFPFPTKVRDLYDYLLIDNPPDIAFNVAAALKVTDEVLIPVKIDEWALEGLDIITDQIEEAKAINPSIKLLGALVTMYRNNGMNVAGVEWLEKNSRVKVLAKVRYTEKAAESTFFNKPVYEYSPRCGAAQDYKHFVARYLGKERA